MILVYSDHWTIRQRNLRFERMMMNMHCEEVLNQNGKRLYRKGELVIQNEYHQRVVLEDFDKTLLVSGN